MQNIRTQVMLPDSLKSWADREGARTGISLAELVRQSLQRERERRELETRNRREIAAQVFGRGRWSDHPEWKNQEDINTWVRSLREERE
jgi:hypothetical protein